MNLRALLEDRIAAALTAAADSDAPLPALVAPAANAKFGDYQANGVMAAAKRTKTNPRALAGKVIDRLDLADLAEAVDVAGPGFINVTLSRSFLEQLLAAAAEDDRLGVKPVDHPQTIVVDYSSPNLAKEMHVGHLRSTIIGDAVARVNEFLGHCVIRQNHIGDWGTQFGMLIAHLETARKAGEAPLESLSDLEQFYRQAKQRFDDDEAFRDRARQTVTRLQGGDAQVLADWEQFRKLSYSHCQQVYQKLGASLTAEDIRGESAYNDDLPQVVSELDARGLLSESDGAQCVFLEGFTNPEGDPLPVIVQKSDGGYLYATTDLAAMRYRVGELRGDRILYLTDARQALHFQQVFAVARAAGFVPENVSLEHVPFGVMLGPDGKPFKTREGGTVKLMDLLIEAEARAMNLVAERNPDISPDLHRKIAHAVGVGAVKYADLSMDRTSDYKFSWEKMLALTGNTAPYMQYAYARVRSIFRKGAEQADRLSGAAFQLIEPAERELGKRLLGLDETLQAVSADNKPNYLTGYLFDLASAFSAFYESCPVLKAEAEVRASRLRLCDLTARVLGRGLDLLGIEVIEQM